MRAGIQADDLTGACDTGAVFASRGLQTVVLLPDAPLPSPAPAILVLDSESRGEPAGEARARARAAAARLAAGQPALLYKKVDSTLRGEIGAEILGVLDGAGSGRVLLAPALPGQRRTVVDGVLRVDGQRGGATAIARDPRFPPTGDAILALLGAGGPHPAGLLPLATLRRGASAVAARLGRDAASLVCDAETDADLALLAEAVEGLPALLAGSAGLAAALAARMPAEHRPDRPRPRRPLLVVAGSAHPVTRAQVARLRARGSSGVLAPPAEAAASPGAREAIVRRLADAARQAIERAPPGTLLLTGGETAYSVCRALGAAGIALAGEVEPGLAIGALLGGPFAGLTVITKAGGFGDPATLARIDEALA